MLLSPAALLLVDQGASQSSLALSAQPLGLSPARCGSGELTDAGTAYVGLACCWASGALYFRGMALQTYSSALPTDSRNRVVKSVHTSSTRSARPNFLLKIPDSVTRKLEGLPPYFLRAQAGHAAPARSSHLSLREPPWEKTAPAALSQHVAFPRGPLASGSGELRSRVSRYQHSLWGYLLLDAVLGSSQTRAPRRPGLLWGFWRLVLDAVSQRGAPVVGCPDGPPIVADQGPLELQCSARHAAPRLFAVIGL
jgi:hypothetical protein